MATFLLVAGAFHGAWCWERLVPLLEARGHRAIARDLPGMGQDRTPLGDIDFESWVRSVVDLAVAAPEKPILVGHSRGGIVISCAADAAPECFAGLVYLSAMLMPAGCTIMGSSADAAETDWAGMGMTPTEDGLGLSLAAEHVGPIFYNRTDPAGVDRAIASVTPEPLWAHTAVIRFGADAARLPRAYIECADDRAIPLDAQRGMQHALPCSPVITLDADHSPFFSDPVALADALDAIAVGLAAER